MHEIIQSEEFRQTSGWRWMYVPLGQTNKEEV